MHRVLLIAAGLTALAGCSRSSTTAEGAAAPAPAGFQGELLQVEKNWNAALARRDTAFFERTLADDFIEVGGEKTETKRDFLAALTGPPDTSFRLVDVGAPILRQYGTTTIITGVVQYPTNERARYTEVWTKENGRWQVHLGHYNRVPPADSMH
jgi:hypothetical protein